MFVKGNSFADLKSYFYERLSSKFSENELKLMLRAFVAERLGVEEQSLIGMDNLKFSESDLLYFHNCQKRLNANEPFQYILGNTWFCDLKLKTDHRALIPRPETEELVMWVVESIREREFPKILDVCSGSGCIALSLKHKLPDSSIWALELSTDAVELINENCKITSNDVIVIKGDALVAETYDLFDDESMDCWVSNPPYIPDGDKSFMEQNVLDFEPHMALFVDDNDSLVFYRKIALEAYKKLEPGGYLFFEIHEELSNGVSDILSHVGFVNIDLRKDLQGKYRMIKASK